MKRSVMVASVIALLLATWATAQPFERGMRMRDGTGPQHRLEMMKEELGLTEDQIEKLQEIRRETEKKIIPVKSEIDLLRLELEEVLGSDSFSESKANGIINRIADKSAEIQKIRMKQMVAKREILTKEQWIKMGEFKKMRKNMKKRGHGARGEQRGGGKNWD